MSDNFFRIAEVENILGFPAHSKGIPVRSQVHFTRVPRGTDSGYLFFNITQEENIPYSLVITGCFVAGKIFSKAEFFITVASGMLKTMTFYELEIVESMVNTIYFPSVQNLHFVKMHFDKIQY